MTDLSAITQHLTLVGSDPALRDAFKRQNPEFFEALAPFFEKQQRRVGSPCPSLATISALQCTLYDNWPSGKQPKKYRPHRWKLSLAAWDTEPNQIDLFDPDFRGGAILMDATQVIEKAHELQDPKKVRRTISDGFRDNLIELATAFPDCLIGPVYSKPRGEGTTYHENQIAVAHLRNNRIIQIDLLLGDGPVRLNQFSPIGPAHKPLPEKAVGSCRATNNEVLRQNWGTQTLY